MQESIGEPLTALEHSRIEQEVIKEELEDTKLDSIRRQQRTLYEILNDEEHIKQLNQASELAEEKYCDLYLYANRHYAIRYHNFTHIPGDDNFSIEKNNFYETGVCTGIKIIDKPLWYALFPFMWIRAFAGTFTEFVAKDYDKPTVDPELRFMSSQSFIDKFPQHFPELTREKYEASVEKAIAKLNR